MRVIRTRPIKVGDEFTLTENGIDMVVRVLAVWPSHDSQGRTGIYFEYLDAGDGRGRMARGYRPRDEFRAKAKRR